jgi:hypothetical protein
MPGRFDAELLRPTYLHRLDWQRANAEGNWYRSEVIDLDGLAYTRRNL